VELRIPIPDAAKAGDRFQVYTDFGTGAIELSSPLLPEPVAIFPGGERRATTAKTFSAKGSAKSGRPAVRIREGAASISSLKLGPKAFRPFLEVVVRVPFGYRNFKFAAQLLDAAGNPQAAPLEEITVFLSGANPPSMRSFELAGYDAGIDQLTFNVSRNDE
jgi:hypothetical protein